MSHWVLWILCAVGAWAGLQLVHAIALMVQLLRVPFRSTRSVLHHVQDAPALGLLEHQRVWVDEIRALGFEPLWQGHVIVGPSQYPVLGLRHRVDAAYAVVTFQASLLTGYPVVFHSFSADGEHFYTQNRMGWLGLEGYGSGKCLEVYTTSVAAQWAAHRAQQIPRDALMNDAEAVQAITRRSDGAFEAIRAAGVLVQSGDHWHMSVATALRCVWAWRRQRRALAKPLDSAMLQGEPLSEFMAQAYVEQETLMAQRPQRHNLKALVLVASMALSLALWGVAFSWPQAVMIVLVLLVHEFGHALAMQLFGWKDMSMFFIPFLGAMVTGKPSRLPAWKQAVVLLAGPVPGLLMGVALLLVLPPQATNAAVDWRGVAVMAISINLFNLLPITPLDGGQLVEIALFSKWPRLRLVFSALSVLVMGALALWLRSELTAVLTALLGFSLMAQWRVAQLQTKWRDGLSHRAQLVNLFAATRESMPKQSPTRLFWAVRAVCTRKLVESPSWKGSAAIVALLLTVWVSAGTLAYLQYRPSDGERDARTSAQQAFDAAWVDLDDDTPSVQAVAGLEKLARALEPSDPRQIDVEAMRIQAPEPAERQARLEAFIQRGRDGTWSSASQLLSDELFKALRESKNMPDSARLEYLQSKVSWAKRTAPLYLATIMNAELRVAEVLDDMGQTGDAVKMLDDLQLRAETVDSCKCKLAEVLRARSWFHLSHQQSQAALQVILESPFAKKAASGKGPLAIDYAWALLLNGQPQPGLAVMTQAVHYERAGRGLLERLTARAGAHSMVTDPLDLAYALQLAGRTQAARDLLLQPSATWQCESARAGNERREVAQPWQRKRDQLLQNAAQDLCPATAAGG